MPKKSDFDSSVLLPPGLEIGAIRRAIQYVEKELAQLVEIYFEQANVFSAIVAFSGRRRSTRLVTTRSTVTSTWLSSFSQSLLQPSALQLG